jgi:hypothetical protein
MTDEALGRSLKTSGEGLFVHWEYHDPAVQVTAQDWVIFRGFNLAELDNYLTEPGWDSEQAQRNLAKLMKARGDALAAWAAGNEPLALALLDFLQSALQLRDHRDALLPLAREGKKFREGRKPGTGSKVRQFIASHLERHPNDHAAAIWDALKKKPPKGVAVYENKLGKYIETDGAPDTGYARFANLVTEERNKLG